jgi:hypothetical protein
MLEVFAKRDIVGSPARCANAATNRGVSVG